MLLLMNRDEPTQTYKAHIESVIFPVKERIPIDQIMKFIASRILSMEISKNSIFFVRFMNIRMTQKPVGIG